MPQPGSGDTPRQHLATPCMASTKALAFSHKDDLASHRPMPFSMRCTRNGSLLGNASAEIAFGVKKPESPSLGSTVIPMQVATGTVINGRIILDGVHLSEGARVTVVARGVDESFTLTQGQEDELLQAMAEIERGDFVTLGDLLKSLPK